MDILRRMFVALMGLTCMVATGILVMTKGWGVEPKSWWWIIGCSIFGNMLGQIFIEIAKHKEDE